jgi:zinc transport system substrate-binding protein
VLDPEGADLTPGPDAYFTLMDRIADSLASCLAPAS